MQLDVVVGGADLAGEFVAGTFVGLVVGVEDELPGAVFWYPDAVVRLGGTREVAHGQDGGAVAAVADIAEDGIIRIISLDPLETVLGEVLGP